MDRSRMKNLAVKSLLDKLSNCQEVTLCIVDSSRSATTKSLAPGYMTQPKKCIYANSSLFRDH
jgi:hypothetical protein